MLMNMKMKIDYNDYQCHTFLILFQFDIPARTSSPVHTAEDIIHDIQLIIPKTTGLGAWPKTTVNRFPAKHPSSSSL